MFFSVVLILVDLMQEKKSVERCWETNGPQPKQEKELNDPMNQIDHADDDHLRKRDHDPSY